VTDVWPTDTGVDLSTVLVARSAHDVTVGARQLYKVAAVVISSSKARALGPAASCVQQGAT
jgi:hypothetical protein